MRISFLCFVVVCLVVNVVGGACGEKERREKLMYDAIGKEACGVHCLMSCFSTPVLFYFSCCWDWPGGREMGREVCCCGLLFCCVVCCVRRGGVLYIIYIPYSNLDGEIIQSNRLKNI